VILMKVKGQSTTEYLVGIGAVVVLALVVAVVAVNLMNSSGVSLSQNKTFWKTQPLGLEEAGTDSNGDTFFVVTNNTGEDVVLTGYVANGKERDFTNTTAPISRGGKKVIFIARQEACGTTGNICSLNNLSFKYTSAAGLSKTSTGNDLLIEKQSNVSIAMFDGQPQALVCVNNGDVGQCGSGGSGGSSLDVNRMTFKNTAYIDWNGDTMVISDGS
jgi:hypothetical protein